MNELCDDLLMQRAPTIPGLAVWIKRALWHWNHAGEGLREALRPSLNVASL